MVLSLIKLSPLMHVQRLVKEEFGMHDSRGLLWVGQIRNLHNTHWPRQGTEIKGVDGERPESADCVLCRLCCLMDQGRKPLLGVNASRCLCSLRAHSALDGVSWCRGPG